MVLDDSKAKIDISNEIFALQECIVVCVVSLEEINITPSTVPYDQCREIRTKGIGAESRLDYIIIPASAAIVATVIIAVIIFVACLKTSQKKRKGKVRTYYLVSFVDMLSSVFFVGIGTIEQMCKLANMWQTCFGNGFLMY